jgi:hypothetical protein
LFAESLQGPHEKRLLHNLLDHYNVLERPVANESDPLQLSFGLTLMQIIDVVSAVLSVIIVSHDNQAVVAVVTTRAYMCYTQVADVYFKVHITLCCHVNMQAYELNPLSP